MKARFFAIAAMVLGLASCAKDFAPEANVAGGEVDFTLAVSVPELAMTRAGLDGEDDGVNGHDSAFGAIDYLSEAEWNNVDLRYILEVYDFDESGKYEGDYGTPIKDRQVQIVEDYQNVTFELRLVQGRKYHFVLFADFVEDGNEEAAATVEAQANIGKHHTIGETLADIKIKNDGINNELTDAYFATKEFTPGNPAHNTETIVLKRPYAKVRVVATDLAELNLNVDPALVEVTYNTTYPTAFNALTGAIGTEEAEVSYEYKYNDGVSKNSLANHYYTAGYDGDKEYTTTDLKGNTLRTHMTLFTDYILATEKQESINFTMTVYDDEVKSEQTCIKTVPFITDIPVKRNHLTTIIGNVLTTATDVKVSIDDNFAQPDFVRNVVYVGTHSKLQEAIDACKEGTTIIFLENDIVGDINIKQQEGINIVLCGNDHTFDGVITVNGDARATKAETLVFDNINFKSNEKKDFIYAPTKVNGKYNYSHNITVENCTFSSDSYNEEIVGIKLQTTYNAVIKNCKAENIHTLAQFYSTDNEVILENLVVENCKNGIALGNIALATIKDVNIVAKGYGIRLDGEKTRTVAATIENAEIEAYIPVNIRKMNNEACNVDVEFIGDNNLLTGSVYEIAFCSNDYEEGVAPQNPVGTFRLQNAEEARAFYGDVVSFSAFDAAINSTNNPEVKAEEKITMNGLGVEVERDVTIDFDNKEFNVGSNGSSTWYALEIKGDYDVNIKNANFTRAGILADGNSNVVFENGTINHKPERTSRYIFCAWNGATITVKDGTFTNDRAKNSFFWADAATIIVEGGNFGGVASNKKIVETSDGQVIIKGGTFNFDPTAWVAEDYKVTKVASNKWEVALDTVAAEDIADALANAADETIYLAEGVDYGTVTAGELKNVTIVGGEGSVMNFVTDANSKLENVTLKSVNFVYDGSNVNSGVVINASAQIDNLVLDGCSFVGTGEKKGRGIYGQNPNATITVKNCHFANMGYPIYTMAAGGYASLVVEGCTFELIKSWAIMPQYNDYLGDLTVNNCNFVNCTGGLVKAGKFTAGHTFTFTNNTITNSSEHPSKNWFTIDTTAASKVVENNTKDGAAWAPADAEGLK